MFTGLVQALGSVAALEPVAGGARLRIDAGGLDLADVAIGDSIAVNGCCLTVTALDTVGFAADVSRETMDCAAGFAVGVRVNLEKALRAGDRLGGHMVTAHVDGVGEIVSIEPAGPSRVLVFRVPLALARYVARKGSVTVDGVSLTVNTVGRDTFAVNLIPHTLATTGFGGLAAGARVNIEVDLIARYVERLLDGDLPEPMQ